MVGHRLSADQRQALAELFISRCTLPSGQMGLLPPGLGELSRGYRVFTGERVTSTAGARRTFELEGLRAMILLNDSASESLEAVSVARAEISRQLEAKECADNPMPGRIGWDACMRCTVALWRLCVVGGVERAEQRLAAGVAGLSALRDGAGAWRGMPFYYTISALIESDLPSARDELRYARPGIERRLPRMNREAEPYATRRRTVLTLALAY